MNPAVWDKIADAFDRLANRNQPVSDKDWKARSIRDRMRVKKKNKRGGKYTKMAQSGIDREKTRRVLEWADHCRAQAKRSALAIDAARAHPTTVGGVSTLGSDAMMQWRDEQRLKGERARALRSLLYS